VNIDDRRYFIDNVQQGNGIFDEYLITPARERVELLRTSITLHDIRKNPG
jgi:hypothetical protein